MDRLTMRELLQVRDIISIEYGISSGDASRAVGVLNVGGRFDDLRAVLAGDLSCVPPALGELGITFKGSAAGSGAAAAASSKAASNIKDNNKRAAAPVGVLGGSVAAAGSASDKKVYNKKKDRIKENKRTAAASSSAGVNTASGITAAAGGLSPSDDLQRVEGDIVPAGVNASGLPDGFGDRVEGWLSDFAERYNIDLVKASGQQWRSACIYVGQNIQQSKVLEDKAREKREGGKIYSPQAVEALLGLWEYVTGLYKHIPLVCDFIAFSGVSRGWFYDYDGRGLTAASAQIAKKARDIEESGLSAGLVDGRENPTGRIYYSKARLGWRESVEIVHKSGAASAAAPALPVFGSDGLLIEDKTE